MKQRSIFFNRENESMTTATSNPTEAAHIGAIIDRRVKAVRARDVPGAVSNMTPDILSFDVVNPLQNSGLEASRKRAEQWFASFEGPIGYEIRDLSITAGEDVAFAHGLSHVSAKRMDGEQLDMWWRTTICFSRIDGQWMATHEHNSVPFDMETGKASLDLKP